MVISWEGNNVIKYQCVFKLKKEAFIDFFSFNQFFYLLDGIIDTMERESEQDAERQWTACLPQPGVQSAGSQMAVPERLNNHAPDLTLS